MFYMFSRCYSLEYLPDISKWNTSNVEFIDYIFEGCKALKSLPDISKWDIPDKEISRSGMFIDCHESLNIPEKFKKLLKK